MIEKKLKTAGIDDMEIIYDHTYYTDIERQKARKRKRERDASPNN